MKTIFEKKLEGYSNKSFLAKKVGVRPHDITYAVKRGQNLKPELKEKYFLGMILANLIKEGEYTIETLYSYTN